MLRQYLHQLLPFKNCRHYADFIILEMLWWRFWKRQSGEFCIVCNWILCYCIRYRNAAITEHGSLSRDNLFCSSRIVHPYRRNQPWFQAYTSVCPRGAKREKRFTHKTPYSLVIHERFITERWGLVWMETLQLTAKRWKKKKKKKKKTLRLCMNLA